MKTNVRQLVDAIPGWLSAHEGQFLAKAAHRVAPLPGVMVEIGSYCGKSTIWLAQTGEMLYAVDPHIGDLGVGQVAPTLSAFLTNLKKAQVDNKTVVPIVKTSAQAKTGWDKPIKLLFIDGLHDEQHAREDYLWWSPFLVDGGVIAMHDAFASGFGVQKVALKYLVGSENYYEIGVVGSIVYGIKGKGSLLTKVNRWRCRQLITLAESVYEERGWPKWAVFVIIHFIVRLGLINRFHLSRNKL